MTFQKGDIPWNKGKHISEATKRKISKALRGKKLSKKTRDKIGKNSARVWLGKHLPKEMREKISRTRKGIKFSAEHKRNLSESKTGKKHWNYGKYLSEKTKQKISEAHRGMKKPWSGKCPRTKETREKLSRINKGKKLSKETKRKMSISSKRMWRSATYRKMMLDGQRKRWLSKEPTSIEKKVYNELKERGLLFEKQKLINGKFLVDAYIPELNLIIEADGDYWHNREDIKKHDKARNAYLLKCGFNLLRLTETEINNNDFLDKLPVTKEN